MLSIYNDTAQLEAKAKVFYGFPELIMMENAATELSKLILSLLPCEPKANVFFACGAGNNGADGMAAARHLEGAVSCHVFLVANIKTTEAKIQYALARNCGVDFVCEEQFLHLLQNASKNDVVVDCIYGTGFHGVLLPKIAFLVDAMNASFAKKIACDIPTGLINNSESDSEKNSIFKSDFTLTFGALKTCLFTDVALNYCGKIIVAQLGISQNRFEKMSDASDAFLIEESDVKLPHRIDKASNKGDYGHVAVFAGEKSGAAIIAAKASLSFGAGRVTLVKAENNNLSQFKIDCELMVEDCIPKSATTVVFGSGLGSSENAINLFYEWFSNFSNAHCSEKQISAVLDADIFYYPKIAILLEKLNALNNTKIILTPHPKELANLCTLCGFGEYDAKSAAKNRFIIGEKFCSRFPNITIIMKSAVTIIACKQNDFCNELKAKDKTKSDAKNEVSFFLCNNGSPSLAKAGSGDVLAGLVASLLAQGYSAKDATITAVYFHAKAANLATSGQESSLNDFSLTPLKLIEFLSKTRLEK